MKLASLRGRGPDGTLIVVDRGLSSAVAVPDIAATLQQAVDNWREVAPRLRETYDALNAGQLSASLDLDTRNCAAPLPRAYQFADGSAYVKHVELVRRARGAELPPRFWQDPLVYQACSAPLMAPHDPILIVSEDHGVDFEAELAVITDFVPMGTKEADAADHMLLFMLVNDVSLRKLVPAELAKGFGFLQSKPTSSFSPVAVTVDELGGAWDGKTLHLEMRSTLRGELFGHPNVAVDQTFTLARLIEHCALTRDLVAGSIIATGTIANIDDDVGHSCIAELRAREMIEHGEATTPFMKIGDRIRIEVLDPQGGSIFGAIDQVVEPYRS